MFSAPDHLLAHFSYTVITLIKTKKIFNKFKLKSYRSFHPSYQRLEIETCIFLTDFSNSAQHPWIRT
jgi:hypothetical protein